MKRRSFLQFLGLAPAAVAVPKIAEAAEKVAGEVPIYWVQSDVPYDGRYAYSTISCSPYFHNEISRHWVEMARKGKK